MGMRLRSVRPPHPRVQEVSRGPRRGSQRKGTITLRIAYSTAASATLTICQLQSQAEHAIEAGRIVRRPVVEFEHPVVRTRPVTKRKALFVNAAFTKRINNLSAAESGRFLPSVWIYNQCYDCCCKTNNCSLTLKMRCCDFSTSTSPKDTSFKSATTGPRTQWRSGTTARPSTTPRLTSCRETATRFV